jgi:clan AA aspartic protease (TIGR02281 family)
MRNIRLFLFLFISFQSFAQSYNLQTGINYFHEEQYDEAADFLNKELQQHPGEGKAYYYLAQIQVNKETFAGGLTQVNLAIKHLAPTDTLLAKAWATKGDIYLRLADTVKFESSYAQALSLFPSVPEIYLSRATQYYSLHWYEKAMADLARVLTQDEGNIAARELMCHIYSDEKKYDALVKEASRIIVLASDNSAAYDHRSFGNFQLKKYDLAIEDAYVALTLVDNRRRLRDNFVVYAKKNYALALAKLGLLINEFPNKEVWHYLRAEIYAEKKEWDKALKEFQTISEIMPMRQANTFQARRGELYGLMGLHEMAIADYTKAIKIDSTDGYDYASRGEAYRLVGKYDLAIADYDRAIELDPESAHYYMQRGWVKDEFQHNPEAGLADYTSAIEIDRGLAYAYLYRGRLYEKYFQDTLRSHADFRQVVLLDSITGSAGNVRQYGYLGLGQADQAKAWMARNLAEFPSDGNYYDAACLYSLLKMPRESIAYLDTAFQKGFRDFTHIAKDDDLDFVRNSPAFKQLFARWQTKFQVDAKQLPVFKDKNVIVGTYKIPYKQQNGGTYEVATKVNGLPLNMLFDTGASDITISRTEVDFMLKNGFLSERDFIGKMIYSMANGANEESKTIMLRRLEIGGLVLTNVFASIVENREAEMLIGQSAMQNLATIMIDNQNKQIVITGKGKKSTK